jgi:hypothetical protein
MMPYKMRESIIHITHFERSRASAHDHAMLDFSQTA